MHPQVNIAVNAARSAGRIIVRALENFNKIEITTKQSPNDFVTSVDRAAEQEIIKIIHKAYPEHAILGEESGELDEYDSDTQWIIDPLDGTLNFVHGVPHFCISIAIAQRGVLTHGVIYDPIRDELFTASKGSGAQLNGRKIRVSTVYNMQIALLGTCFTYKRQAAANLGYEQAFINLLRAAGDMRCAGSAALELAYVAAGRIDGFWGMNLQAWDLAAGALLIREAGGLVGNFVGDNDQDFLDTGKIIVANPKLFTQLVAELGKLG